MCLGSICRGSAARTDRDLRQSCKRLYERHHLGSAGARGRARRGAGDIQMASISAKLLPISTRNLADADLPSREEGEAPDRIGR